MNNISGIVEWLDQHGECSVNMKKKVKKTASVCHFFALDAKVHSGNRRRWVITAPAFCLVFSGIFPYEVSGLWGPRCSCGRALAGCRQDGCVDLWYLSQSPRTQKAVFQAWETRCHTGRSFLIFVLNFIALARLCSL